MSSQQSSSIIVNELSKQYAGSTAFALDGISLRVAPGEVYGFLGPNGAGKSTAIRLLMNFIQPTSGSAQVLGLDIVRDAVAIKNNVGYLAGDFAVYPKMSGRKYLTYLDALAGGSHEKYAMQLADRLQAELDRPLGELSRGNRQKIGVVQAFMQKPKVLILDEPTTGLDPLMQEVFYELIAEEKARGAAIFMSSHILSEVQKTCDRVGIIKEGKLVSEQSIAEMSAEAAQTFDITFTANVPLAELQKIPGLKLVGHQEQHVTVHMHGKLTPLFALLAKSDVRSISARALDLEELFLGLYQGVEGKR